MKLSPKERAGVLRRRHQAEVRKAKRAVAPKREKAHRGRECDPGFLAYLRRQPCEATHMGGCQGPIEAAHIRYSDAQHGRNPGLQRKNHDRHANPLCWFHHQHDQHRRNERRFWESIGKNAYERAAHHYSSYRANMPENTRKG